MAARNESQGTGLSDPRVLTLGLDKVLALAARPGRREVAVGSRSGSILRVGLDDGEVKREYKGHDRFITALAWRPDGERLLSTGNDKTLREWEVNSGEFLQDLSGIVRGPQAKTLAGQYMRGARPGHSLTPLALAWTGGELIGTGGQDRAVKMWRDGQMQRTFDWHTGPVSAVAFRPDSEELLSASHDQTLRTWDHVTGSMVHKYTGHEGPIDAAAWIDADRIASADLVGQLLIWDVERERVIGRAPLASSPLRALVVDLPRGRLYVGAESGALYVHDLDDERLGERLGEVEAHTGSVRALALSDDGQTLISGGNDGLVKLWSLS